jgi:hypothetical protein
MKSKSETISLQRRHLMIAGTITAVTAGSLYAAAQTFSSPSPTRTGAATSSSLLASGRIVTADGKPLAGADIIARQLCSGSEPCRTATDADGRFVFETATPQGAQPMLVYVTHPEIAPFHTELRFGQGRNAGNVIHAQTLLDRDTLRASFALTVA